MNNWWFQTNMAKLPLSFNRAGMVCYQIWRQLHHDDYQLQNEKVDNLRPAAFRHNVSKWEFLSWHCVK